MTQGLRGGSPGPPNGNDTGVMTFIVNHDGNVYQKNLGAGTDAAARAMKAFSPDKTWTQVPDSTLIAKPVEPVSASPGVRAGPLETSSSAARVAARPPGRAGWRAR